MTKHIKMGTYTNPVKTRIELDQHVVFIEATKRRRVHRKKRQSTNLYWKVKLVHSKKEGVVYIRHSEYDVENKTKFWVYFDARYTTDPNVRYNEETDSWFHYSTPGLFRNVTNLRFKNSINSWVLEQSHPHITIIWTNRK